jgi:hypothetical protein
MAVSGGGAGRKPNPVKILLKGTTRGTLLQALENVPPELVAAKINKLLQSKKEIIWLQTLNFIYDRILGKPKQDVSVSGAFIHAQVSRSTAVRMAQRGPGEASQQVRRRLSGSS